MLNTNLDLVETIRLCGLCQRVLNPNLQTRLKDCRNILMTLFVFMTLVCNSAHAQSAPPAPAIAVTGEFGVAQTVTMPDAPNGTNVYYTTNGSTPTNASTLYTAPFTVSSSSQIKAVEHVTSSGLYSSVTSVFVQVPILLLTADAGLKTSIGSPAPVVTWTDQSSGGNNATANSSNPLLKDNAIQGYSAINFDGSTQYFSLPSGFSGFNGATIFVVFEPTALANGSTIIDLGDGASGNDILLQEISSSGNYYGQVSVYNGTSATSANSTSNQLTANQYQLLEAEIVPGSPNSTATVYLNGVPGTANTAMNNIPSVLRTTNLIGQASAGGNFFAGAIGEVLVYPNALDETSRQSIEAWLMQKYQILSQVPTTPVISVPGGTLTQPTQVVIASQPGTATYYTTDTSTPSVGSQVYTGGPIMINYGQTLKTISIRNGVASGVATAIYQLDSTLWPAPLTSQTSAPSIQLQLPTQ